MKTKRISFKLLALVTCICVLFSCSATDFSVYAKTKYKYVYVVTKVNEVTKCNNRTHKNHFKITYSSNGLITKITKTTEDSLDDIRTQTFTYKSKKLMSKTSGSGVERYKYNTKGQIIESYRDGSDSRRDLSKIKFDKKGRLKTDGFNTYFYNKYNCVTKRYYNKRLFESYEYDKNGNLKYLEGSSSYHRYYHTYNKDNRMTKSSITISGSGTTSYGTVKYKYKKIRVPASYVKTINQQQRFMLNFGADIWDRWNLEYYNPL